MSVAVERFSTEQEAKMRQAVTEWRKISRVAPANRSAVEKSISVIYRDLNLNPPHIIWCDSHAQLVVIYTLIALLKIERTESAPSLQERLKSQLQDPWWKLTLDQALKVVEQRSELCTITDLKTGFESLFGRGLTEAAIQRRVAVGSAVGEVLEREFGVAARLAVRQHLLQNLHANTPLVNGGALLGFGLLNRNIFFDTPPGAWLCSLVDQDTQTILQDMNTKLSDRNRLRLEQGLPQLFPLLQGQLNLLRVGDATAACAFLVDNFDVPVDDNKRNLVLSWLCLKRNLLDFEFFERFCLVSERPGIATTNDRGQMHSDQGAAMVFRDGYKLHFIDGVRIPAAVSSEVSIEDIEKEQNVEVRRIMIRRYGLEKYLSDSNAQVIDRNECGTLYKKSNRNEEPLVVVKVTNSTVEPDGSRKEYLLRVPPYIASAKAAVAWTFDLPPEDYSPDLET